MVANVYAIRQQSAHDHKRDAKAEQTSKEPIEREGQDVVITRGSYI